VPLQINPTGLTELGVVQLPAGASPLLSVRFVLLLYNTLRNTGMYSSPSHLAVHSFPEAHHFMVAYDRTDDPQVRLKSYIFLSYCPEALFV
jgi:S-adenosylmethionine/arginine decarboxylase-like enzyme